jgi:hypothetical protein
MRPSPTVNHCPAPESWLGLVLNAVVLWITRYSFTASVPREGLRPLRDPDAVELDDDDDGGEDV